MALLEIESLSIAYEDPTPVVDQLSLSMNQGEVLGIVGESGSGKTQTALALLGLLPANARISGNARFDGIELIGATGKTLNKLRACRLAMIFQDPGTALNPYLRIGAQVQRILTEHGLCSATEARARTLSMLERVGLPDPERQYTAWPHELSGGMKQRVLIGAALIAEPELLIADEPTTALDVTIQAQILALIRELRAESGCGLLLITHDLGVIAGECERVMFMDRGRKVEEGSTGQVFERPQSGCAQKLLASATGLTAPTIVSERNEDTTQLLSMDRLSVTYGKGGALKVLRPMSLEIDAGETIAVVGESGSGKTSLVRSALGLVPPDTGNVTFLGRTLPPQLNGRDKAIRRELQMVFQNPLSSLNPAMRIRDIVTEPLQVHESQLSSAARAERVDAMLAEVGLATELGSRLPHELSGGQAQRVAIARALILRPRVLVCDEAVAALDGTVRKDILTLLMREQRENGLALIFITHDLSVVRLVSHRVLVMYMGALCELADAAEFFARPRHPYSKALLSAVPEPDPSAGPPEVPLLGETPSLIKPPSGCLFHTRCPHAIAICAEEVPPAEQMSVGQVACHRAGELDLSY